MKTFLKSSVSVFVLLSTFSAFTPSLGMEEGEEKKPDKRAAKQCKSDRRLSKAKLKEALDDFKSQDAKRVNEGEEYLKKVLERKPEGYDEDSIHITWQRTKALGALFASYLEKNNKEDSFRELLNLASTAELEKLLIFGGEELPNTYYPFAILILEEADKRFDRERRFKTRIRLDMARLIVETKDKTRFDLAEAYLQEVREHPPENDGDVFYSNYSTYLNSEKPRALSILFRLYLEKGDEEAFHKLLSSLDQADLKNLITPFVFKKDYGRDSLPEALISEHLFLPSLAILTEANKWTSNLPERHPLRLRIGLNMAECILGNEDRELGNRDQERFSEAERYISKVIDPQGELSSTPGESSACDRLTDDPLTLNLQNLTITLEKENEGLKNELSQAGIKPPESNEEKISDLTKKTWEDQNKLNQNVAYHLQAALRVHQGQFDKASEYLKTLSKDNEFGGLEAVLIALKGQVSNPDLSNEFITLVGDANFQDIISSPQSLIDELKKGRGSLRAKESILQYIKSNKWFFDIAIERGLLDPVEFNNGLGELSQKITSDTSTMLSTS